jgi:hypothetical protein
VVRFDANSACYDSFARIRTSARCLRQSLSGCDSILLEEEVVAADAKVFNNVGNDATRHIARVPGKCYEPFGMKWI